MPLNRNLRRVAHYLGIGVVTVLPFAGHFLPHQSQALPVFPPLGGLDILLKSIAEPDYFCLRNTRKQSIEEVESKYKVSKGF